MQVPAQTMHHRIDQDAKKYPQDYLWQVCGRHPVLTPGDIDQWLQQAFPLCAECLPGQNAPACSQAIYLIRKHNSAGLHAIAQQTPVL